MEYVREACIRRYNRALKSLFMNHGEIPFHKNYYRLYNRDQFAHETVDFIGCVVNFPQLHNLYTRNKRKVMIHDSMCVADQVPIESLWMQIEGIPPMPAL